jgi:hypothetical protein
MLRPLATTACGSSRWQVSDGTLDGETICKSPNVSQAVSACRKIRISSSLVSRLPLMPGSFSRPQTNSSNARKNAVNVMRIPPLG